MKIEKYTKLKNGQYKLNFDNNTSAILHEDLILKYNLLIHKKVDESSLEKMLEENTSYLAYDLAISYLKSKMRSEKEIKEYLIKKGVKENLANDAIKLLQKQNYLNDNIYCKAFIADKLNLSSDGPYKVKESLRKLGISDEIILKNIDIFTTDLEKERIKKLISKQIKTNRNKSTYVIKRKITDYLVNLGYSKEIVIREVNNINIDDKDIVKKEYEKIYSKLSKKYSGKELEYKIKQKMYQKGFFQE